MLILTIRIFYARIEVEGDTTEEARNKILRVLARGELDGDLVGWSVPFEERKVPI